jgi:hypothetical protein
MKMDLGSSLLSAVLLGVFGLFGTPRQPTACPPGNDSIYVYENGRFVAKQCYGGAGADGSRWMCFRGTSNCDPCAACHSTTETSDRSYVAKYDAGRHRTVHFPKFTATLSAGQKLPLSPNEYLHLANGELVVALSSGKDAVLIPSGSKILLNRQREPRLIALPAIGEPKSLP